MKISLNLFKPRIRVLVSDKLPTDIKNRISKCQEPMECLSKLQRNKKFKFVPHFSQSGNIDCVLANYGASTKTIALDAKIDRVFEIIMELSHKEPMNYKAKK